jgi:hypothetical protein
VVFCPPMRRTWLPEDKEEGGRRVQPPIDAPPTNADRQKTIRRPDRRRSAAQPTFLVCIDGQANFRAGGVPDRPISPAFWCIGRYSPQPEACHYQASRYFLGSASCSTIQAQPLWGTGFLSAFFTIWIFMACSFRFEKLTTGYFLGSASCSTIHAQPLWGTGFLSAFLTIWILIGLSS